MPLARSAQLAGSGSTPWLAAEPRIEQPEALALFLLQCRCCRLPRCLLSLVQFASLPHHYPAARAPSFTGAEWARGRDSVGWVRKGSMQFYGARCTQTENCGRRSWGRNSAKQGRCTGMPIYSRDAWRPKAAKWLSNWWAFLSGPGQAGRRRCLFCFQRAPQRSCVGRSCWAAWLPGGALRSSDEQHG